MSYEERINKFNDLLGVASDAGIGDKEWESEEDHGTYNQVPGQDGPLGNERTTSVDEYSTNTGDGSSGDRGGLLGPEGGLWDDPDPYTYLSPGSFVNQRSDQIYNTIGAGFDRANTPAPVAAATLLGQASQGTAAQMSPQMMLSGAQMSPQMMANAAQLDTGQDQQLAAAQLQQANALNLQAQGLGPSVAETAAQQRGEASLAAQLGMLGSQRGAGGGAAALRRGADANAATQREAAAQGALGRSQEALAARDQLSGVLQGTRGLSQATSQTQAGMNQQALLANQSQFNQASGTQAGLNQQAAMGNQGTSLAGSQANLGAANTQNLANQQALNAFMQQQGTMDHATTMANLQTAMQNRQINEQQYFQMLSALQQQGQADVSNAVEYERMLAQQQQAILQINSGNQISNGQQASGMLGAGMSALGTMAMGAATVASDRRLKRDVRSGERALTEFYERLV